MVIMRIASQRKRTVYDPAIFADMCSVVYTHSKSIPPQLQCIDYVPSHMYVHLRIHVLAIYTTLHSYVEFRSYNDQLILHNVNQIRCMCSLVLLYL